MHAKIASRCLIDLFFFGTILLFTITSIVPTQNTHAQAPKGRPDSVRKGPQIESLMEVTEVLLDLVARDWRDNLVRDLKESEVEVYEDGVKQRVTSFTVVEKGDLTLESPAERVAPKARSSDPVVNYRCWRHCLPLRLPMHSTTTPPCFTSTARVKGFSARWSLRFPSRGFPSSPFPPRINSKRASPCWRF